MPASIPSDTYAIQADSIVIQTNHNFMTERGLPLLFADDLQAGMHAYARNVEAPLVLPRHLF